MKEAGALTGYAQTLSVESSGSNRGGGGAGQRGLGAMKDKQSWV